MTLRTRIHLLAAAILLGGLGTALYLYLTAGEAADPTMVELYQGSKRYRHELEAYGGKVNVLASDFARWFDGLWHGPQLAGTVAVLAIVAALLVLAIGRLFTTDAPDEGRDDSRQDHT